ncbi:MAG TPA: hypothetical protein VFD03_11995 [Clostridia bacterium]|nr:hypothetical protein [Clostridia bacterium]
MIVNMHMIHAYSIDEAMQIAWDIKGKETMVTVIPHGVGVIVS